MARFARLALFAVVVLSAHTATAAINFSVTFDDPNGDLTAAANLIDSHVKAAGKLWADHLVGNADIEVVVRTSTAIPYSEGRSFTSSFVRNNGTFDVFEQGMAAEIRTGVDPNGATPDVLIEINPNYVYNELWFDPNPLARTATVDINRTDAMSSFLHEFGHALGYSGWINGTTGTYPGTYQSTYDERTTFNGTNFFFNGPEAVQLYGSAVPLTFANVSHVANFSPRPGEDLLMDLMNGLVYYRGSRYDIEPLNIAMLRDVGLPAIYMQGDYNVDGKVDATDHALWRASYGSTTSPFVDGNRDGVVNTPDYVLWRKKLGATIFGQGSGASVAVPEPVALVMLASGAAALLVGRRRSRAVALPGFCPGT